MAVTRKNCFSAIRHSLILAVITAFALLLAVPASAYASGTGNLTVNAADGSSTEFVAYQIFTADVADGSNGTKTVANIAWANDTAASVVPEAIKSVNPSASIKDADGSGTMSRAALLLPRVLFLTQSLLLSCRRQLMGRPLKQACPSL